MMDREDASAVLRHSASHANVAWNDLKARCKPIPGSAGMTARERWGGVRLLGPARHRGAMLWRSIKTRSVEPGKTGLCFRASIIEPNGPIPFGGLPTASGNGLRD